jgi:hypothetical protein
MQPALRGLKGLIFFSNRMPSGMPLPVAERYDTHFYNLYSYNTAVPTALIFKFFFPKILSCLRHSKTKMPNLFDTAHDFNRG